MSNWRVIPNTEGLYEASDMGEIRREGRILKQGHNHKGYPRVYLSIKNKQTTVLVHKLVLLAFVGPAPVGHETLHKNNIKTDNRLSNLRWGTRSENIQQTYDEGRISWFATDAAKIMRKNKLPRGEHHCNTHLSNKKVVAIRKLYSTGKHTLASLGNRYGIHLSTIHRIVTNKTWRVPLYANAEISSKSWADKEKYRP